MPLRPAVGQAGVGTLAVAKGRHMTAANEPAPRGRHLLGIKQRAEHRTERTVRTGVTASDAVCGHPLE
jgi:hypothetical protein